MTKDSLFNYYCVPMMLTSIVSCLLYIPQIANALIEYPSSLLLSFVPVTLLISGAVPWMVVDMYDLLEWKH